MAVAVCLDPLEINCHTIKTTHQFDLLNLWSFVDVPLIFSCPADHVPNWQPRILLGMVEARSVNVKNTTTTYILGCSDGMEREACVCDHGFDRSDLCTEIIIIIIIMLD